MPERYGGVAGSPASEAAITVGFHWRYLGGMFQGITTRYQYWKAVLGWGWRMTGVLYAAFGALTFVRDNFISPEHRALYDTFRFLPHWPLLGWLFGGALLTFIAALEGSYRLAIHREKQYNATLSALQAQLNDKAHRAAIRNRLGEAISEGCVLQKRCLDTSQPVPRQEIEQWGERTEMVLRTSLGASYVDVFRTRRAQDCPPAPLNRLDIEHPHLKYWHGIDWRIKHLRDFILNSHRNP